MSKVIDNIEDIASIDNHIGLSGITAYHLLQGNLAVDNTVTTQGFSTTLYTGNGSTQSINTGIDMDTQWGNDASEKFGGLVWVKSRSDAYNNILSDTINGVGKYIKSNSTDALISDATMLTAFNTNGFTSGTNANINGASPRTYASWNFQATHRTSGTTNHGKAYTCHYNPFTGFTIVKYEGSGIAGHEIPHHLGRKLDLGFIKNLTDAGQNWSCTKHSIYLNLTDAGGAIGDTDWAVNSDSNLAINATTSNINTNAKQYIMYGWANSYFDENKLIGNYEIGTYQGTGVAGNNVITRGKPAWVMIKRIDSTGNWHICDVLRSNFDARLVANQSIVESTAYEGFVIGSNYFEPVYNQSEDNASGGQYLYMVVYDNDSASGKSKYPRATDTTQIQLNNAIVPLANGIDTNGVKVSTVSKNETVTGVTLTQGKNYIKIKEI